MSLQDTIQKHGCTAGQCPAGKIASFDVAAAASTPIANGFIANAQIAALYPQDSVTSAIASTTPIAVLTAKNGPSGP